MLATSGAPFIAKNPALAGPTKGIKLVGSNTADVSCPAILAPLSGSGVK